MQGEIIPSTVQSNNSENCTMKGDGLQGLVEVNLSDNRCTLEFDSKEYD